MQTLAPTFLPSLGSPAPRLRDVINLAVPPAAAPAGSPPGDQVQLGGFPADQVARLQADGWLPADFATRPTADRRSLFAGATTVAATPYLQTMAAALRPGDVVVVHGTDPVVTPFDGGTHWVHAALVSSTQPMRLVEAYADGQGGRVREVPFAQFVDGTPAGGADGEPRYRVIHPTADGALADRAIAFARAQVGKPYDYTYGLVGGPDGRSWICSGLVDAAYHRAAGTAPDPLLAKADPQRSKLLAFLQDLIASLHISDRTAMNALVQRIAASPLFAGDGATASLDDVADSALQVLAGSPSFRHVARDPDGARVLKASLVDGLKRVSDALRDGAAPDAGQFVSDLFGHLHQMPFLVQLRLGLKGLWGLGGTDPLAGWRGFQDLQHGGAPRGFVAPADLAEGGNGEQRDFGP